MALRLVAVTAIAIATGWSDSHAGIPAAYSIDFHAFSSGGSTLHNSCFSVSGTVGQTAPGYSSDATDSIYAGFWSAAATAGLDQLFFSGFEGC